MTNKIDKIQMPDGQVLELNGGGSTWGLITGNIAAQTDLQTALDSKQDIITDLATIRSGASKGATALQSYTETDPVYTADKPNIANINLNNLSEAGLKVIKDNSGGGLEVGDIGMALYVDETKGLRRYLNGQIVDINTNTQAFLNRLLEIKNTNPDYFATEENWQSEALLNIDGCVYKFVLNYSGETVVSVRLPKYPDYVEINAGGTLPVVGNGMTLGFSNGIDNAGISVQTNGSSLFNTDLYGKPVNTAFGAHTYLTTGKSIGITTDGTKSGIQTTLKQTKLKLRYFIQIATGSETEANIVNTLENVNGFTLLESKYSDKPLYNESWLLSNGQYNPKATYPTAYEGLQVEHNTGIEAGTTITLPSGVSYTKRGLSVKLSTETYTDYDFVLNTAEETFRLPLKTKQKFYDDTAPVVGNSTALGLNNGSTFAGLGSVSGGTGPSVVAYDSIYGKNINSTVTSGNKVLGNLGITTDPTKSGIETHLTETILYLYFYVGDLDQNHGIVNMGRIGEQLATKTDMLQASGAGMPSDKYIDLTLGASGSTYTAPANGYFSVGGHFDNANGYFSFGLWDNVAGRIFLVSEAKSNSGSYSCYCYVPVKKGYTVFANYNYSPFSSTASGTPFFRFIYAEGSK